MLAPPRAGYIRNLPELAPLHNLIALALFSPVPAPAPALAEAAGDVVERPFTVAAPENVRTALSCLACL